MLFYGIVYIMFLYFVHDLMVNKHTCTESQRRRQIRRYSVQIPAQALKYTFYYYFLNKQF